MTDRVSRGNCPPDETLAAFIDGGLDAAGRKRISLHLTGCGNCYDVWLTAHEVRTSMMPPLAHVRRWPVALGAALITAVLVAVVLLMTPLRERLPKVAANVDIDDLANAAPPHRIVDGRLAGFPYRPLEPAKRGKSTPSANPDYWKLYSVAGQIAEEAKKAATPEKLHALGVSYVLLGQWNEAVATLEEALRKETRETVLSRAIHKSSNVALLNDLSVAYTARGKQHGKMLDLIAAIESADRAFARSKSPEVAFNRALAVEAAYPGDPAVAAAWTDFTRLESRSPWRDEATIRLERATPVSAPRSSTESLQGCYSSKCEDAAGALGSQYLLGTTFTLETVLPDWANATRSGDDDRAAYAMGFAEAVARAISSQTGDMFVADVVRSAQQHRLVEAHLDYAAARQMYRHSNYSGAIPPFSRARDASRAAGSALELLASNYLAGSLTATRNRSAASAEMRAMFARFDREGSRYYGALGMAWWGAGVHAIKSGHPQAALDAYRKALRRFEQAKQSDNVAAAHSLIAEAAQYNGDSETAWSERGTALRSFEYGGQLDRLWIILGEVADAAHADGWLYAAARWRAQLLAATVRLGDTGRVAYALTTHAQSQMDIGHVARAAADLLAARAKVDAIEDPLGRSLGKAWLSLNEARFAAIAHPELEESLLTSAVDTYLAAADHFSLTDALLRRARIRFRAGRIDDAKRDLRTALAELESIRGGFGDPSARARYFGRSQELFDLAIACAWKERAYEDAFNLAERSRGRALLDASASKPLTLRETMSALAPDSRLVEYAIIPGSLLIWVVSSNSYRAVAVPMMDSAPARLVNHVRLATTDAEYLQASGALHDALISPVASEIAGAKRLIFVPNKQFADVSFASLYDRRAQRFVIEMAQSVVTPSASAYAFASERDRSLTSQATTAFISGHPGGETLAELPDVDSEVRRVANVYPGAERVVPINDKLDFLRRSSKASIVHFAGHGVGNDAYPEFAFIALGARSPLHAYEIARSTFARTRVVVLSSCGTRAGGHANERALGVPYAFLAAGVPAVLAATDDVPDADAAGIIVRFHTALARSGHPSEAFQSMQVEMIRNRVSPRHWGVWQFLGGPNT